MEKVIVRLAWKDGPGIQLAGPGGHHRGGWGTLLSLERWAGEGSPRKDEGGHATRGREKDSCTRSMRLGVSYRGCQPRN